MELSGSNCKELHITLKELLAQKSKRDKITFTIYQLAKALNMPHSILNRLIHENTDKRVNNPRIDTLTKIVDFFKSDGFNLTVDDLLYGVKTEEIVEASSLNLANKLEKNIVLCSFDDPSIKIGSIDVKLLSTSNNLIALLSNEDIKPIFKKGSIFIIDTVIRAEHDTLVAVKESGKKQISIWKYYIADEKKVLNSLDDNSKINLTDSKSHILIGVVVQINAKT